VRAEAMAERETGRTRSNAPRKIEIVRS